MSRPTRSDWEKLKRFGLHERLERLISEKKYDQAKLLEKFELLELLEGLECESLER